MPILNRDQAREALRASLAHCASSPCPSCGETRDAAEHPVCSNKQCPAHYVGMHSAFERVQDAAMRRNLPTLANGLPRPDILAAQIVVDAKGDAREAYHYLDVLTAAVGVALNDYKRGT